MERKKNAVIKIIIVSVLAILCCFAYFLNPHIRELLLDFNVVTNDNALLVHFIYAGQGDAMAINFPNGEVMLIDSGVHSVASSYVNYLNEKVMNNDLDNNIDYFVLTHADNDHIGGAINVFQNFEVETIYMPKLEDTTDDYKEFAGYVKSNNYDTKIAKDDETMIIAGCKITFLSAGSYTKENDASYVLKVEYLNKSFLFTGDIGKKVESDLVDKYGSELDCDVLKVAHHGSDSSTSYKFVECVTPEYAIISCGIDNWRQYPKDIVISNLKVVNSNIHRTDLDGSTVFVVSDNYDLVKLSNDYTITNLSLDCRFLIITIQIIIIFGLVVDIIVIIKQRRKQKD